MTVYEIIQFLSKYEADKQVKFRFNGELHIDEDKNKAFYDDVVEIEEIHDENELDILFTN